MPEFIVGATGNGAVALETENFGHEDLRFHVVVSGGDDPLRSWWWNGTAWKEHYGQASCGATPYVVYQHLMRTSQLTFSIPEPPACARYKAPMNGPLGASHFEGRAKVLQGPADLGSPMVTLTLEIRIGVITHIRPETTFAAGLSPADLVNTRVFHVLICANSYDPKPPRGFTHQRNGTYVLARVSR